MTDRTVKVTLTLSAENYKAELEKARKSTQGLGDETKKTEQKADSALGRMLQNIEANEKGYQALGTGMAAVGTVVTGIGLAALKTGIEYNTLQQTSRAALTSILGSAGAAADQMDRLDEFARTSPFSKQTFIQAQQQMLAFGIEARKVVPYLDAIQNAVAAAGGDENDIRELAGVMAGISSSAKITATDLDMFGSRGVDAAEIIGSQMGKTAGQIRSEITAGSLDAGVALDALAAGMDQKFDGAADNVKNTFAGAMDRVKAAWRDLSSALAEPFVGTNGGGIFTALLNESADLMRQFEDLPGPVRLAVTSLTGLVGLGSLVGGSFLLMAPRIAETKAALEELGPNAQRAGTLMSGLGKAVGIAALAFAAWKVAEMASWSGDTTVGVEKLTGAILDVAEGADGAQTSLDALFSATGSRNILAPFSDMTEGINGVADAFDKADRNVFQSVGNKLTPWKDGFDQANEFVKQLDASLAKLVAGGNADQAAEFMRKLSKETGKPLDELLEKLPAYSDSLAGVDNANRLAGESTGTLTERFEEYTAALEKAAEGAIGQREAEIALAESFAAANQAIADGAQITRDSTGAVDLNVASSRNAEAALLDLATGSAQVTQAMRDNNVASEEVNAAQVRQREQFIATATQMGYTRGEAELLADRYGLLDGSKKMTVFLEMGSGWWDTYNTMVSHINTVTGSGNRKQDLSNLLMPGYDSGGAVYGPGSGTSDSIVARVSNGEHVWTASEVQAAGGHDAMYRMRATIRRGMPGFARGGEVNYAQLMTRPVVAQASAPQTSGVGDLSLTVIGRPDMSSVEIGRSAAQELAFAARGSGRS